MSILICAGPLRWVRARHRSDLAPPAPSSAAAAGAVAAAAVVVGPYTPSPFHLPFCSWTETTGSYPKGSTSTLIPVHRQLTAFHCQYQLVGEARGALPPPRANPLSELIVRRVIMLRVPPQQLLYREMPAASPTSMLS